MSSEKNNMNITDDPHSKQGPSPDLSSVGLEGRVRQYLMSMLETDVTPGRYALSKREKGMNDRAVLLYKTMVDTDLVSIINQYPHLTKKKILIPVAPKKGDDLLFDLGMNSWPVQEKEISRDPNISAGVGLNLLVQYVLGCNSIEVAGDTVQQNNNTFICLVRRGIDWEFVKGRQIYAIDTPWKQEKEHIKKSKRKNRQDTYRFSYTNNYPFINNGQIYLVEARSQQLYCFVEGESGYGWEERENV